MSDETPQSEGEPSPATPDETPTAENKPDTNDDAVKNTGDEDDVAPPAAAAPAATPDPEVTQAAPAAPATPAAAPVAAAPTATAPAERPAGIFVPKWVGLVAAAIVAALVFGGIGYAIGDSSSGSGSPQSASVFPGNGNGTRRLPNGGQLPGNGNGPFGNQVPNGNGNGNTGGNGTGGNGTGNNGGPAASDAAFLGVGVGTADKGVQVTEVANGSPAATAGLQTGDVITAIDNTTVNSPLALRAAVEQHKSGDQVTVTYTRGGQSNSVKVTLTSRSTAQSS